MNVSIFNQLKQLLVERFSIDASLITLKADLQKELKLDSVDAVDLLLTVDEAYCIRIPDTMLTSIHTVGDLVNVIEKHLPARQ